MKQASLDDFNPKSLLDTNNAKPIKIYRKIMNMVGMDNQPLSIVNDQGFIELKACLQQRYLIPSTKFFNETMLPQTYNNLKMKIGNELSEGSF